jgi:hypothetical protein
LNCLVKFVMHNSLLNFRSVFFETPCRSIPALFAYSCRLLIKAWFNDGKIIGCTWVILLNFPTLQLIVELFLLTGEAKFVLAKPNFSLLRIHEFISCEMFRKRSICKVSVHACMHAVYINNIYIYIYKFQLFCYCSRLKSAQNKNL